MLSCDSGQGESICTPRSVSKRLFGAGSGSSKRNLFSCVRRGVVGVGGPATQDTEMSGEDSDLGPMSPLELTDRSDAGSCESSPGRQFVSPFTTPEKSPYASTTKFNTWDRLRPSSSSSRTGRLTSSLSPFSSLRMSTRAARTSPKRRILENSPKSLALTPERQRRRRNIDASSMGTPEREIALLFESIVPETPQKETSDGDDVERIEETPRKELTNDREDLGRIEETPRKKLTNDSEDFERIEETPRKRLTSDREDFERIEETPRKTETSDRDDVERIEETPQKDESPVRAPRLITPLGSVLKPLVVPRLHRRKSVCPFDDEETSSPERKENALKRHAIDVLASGGAKFPKIDESSTIPRARASLFRETKENSSPVTEANVGNFTLSAKSFYKSAGDKRGHSMGPDWRDPDPTRKRHSLPSYMTNHTYHRRATKRQRNGEMNAGVRHGIKRPKPKRHVSRVEAFKRETSKASPESSKSLESEETRMNDERIEPEAKKPKTPVRFTFAKVERPPPTSPIADPNKRFFKTNRTIKSHRVATVTVSSKIKLNVTDGKFALNERRSRRPRKKPRLEEISFDATDLTVDEPGFDTSMQKRDVDGILKALEDDWADDDYDTMDTLTAISPVRQLAKPAINAAMSPASVLSDMTSSMNIEDPGVGSGIARITDVRGSTDESAGDTGKKLFPLFEKGFSSGIGEESAGKKTPRGIKRSWQTSMKSGCGGAEDQYQIDAGQKRFGATACKECGVVYQLGDPEDENAHLNYHNSYKTLKFNGWKKERVVMTDPFTNSRIIAIEPSDPRQCWRKVEEVLAVVDMDLGLADMELSSYLDKKIYFYVRDKTILGVMVAESIKTAHRMIPELLELDCCSDEETPAKCGVNVIWTAMSHRRRHIATKLLDTVRATYFFGYIMSIDDIAFSMPTPSGKIFAESYTKTRNFKVYT